MKLRLLSGLLLVALGAGCGKKAATDSPTHPPQEVGVVTLKPETVEIVTELPGRTAAYRVAEVRPQVSGVILRRLFTEGGNVEAGEQLYQIDPATYQANYDHAQASVAKSEALVQIARVLSDRREKLVKSKVISTQDFDDAKAGFMAAQADLAAAKANLEKARIDLDYTRVRSPIAGTIGRSAVTEGALVTSGQAGELATVQQLDPIYVDVTQSSTQLLRLQRDVAAGKLQNIDNGKAKARLILEDGTEYPEPGTLQFSEVSVDTGTGSVTLRAVFPNPRRLLLPGMFVRAAITEGVKENAILVPQRGVTRNQKGEPIALVVGPGNRVDLRVLETSRAIGDKWLVTKGVEAGDRVIVEGLQKTGPGAEVKPVEIESAAAAQ